VVILREKDGANKMAILGPSNPFLKLKKLHELKKGWFYLIHSRTRKAEGARRITTSKPRRLAGRCVPSMAYLQVSLCSV